MCTYLYLDRHNKLNYIFSEPSFTAWFWIRSTTANTTITSSIINCPEFCQLSQTTILSFTPSPDKSANDILSMLIWKMKTSSDPNLLTWVYYKILKNMSTHFDFFVHQIYRYVMNSNVSWWLQLIVPLFSSSWPIWCTLDALIDLPKFWPIIVFQPTNLFLNTEASIPLLTSKGSKLTWAWLTGTISNTFLMTSGVANWLCHQQIPNSPKTSTFPSSLILPRQVSCSDKVSLECSPSNHFSLSHSTKQNQTLDPRVVPSHQSF